MIRINQLKVNIDSSENQLRKAILKHLRISDSQLVSYTIVKKSIDARDKTNIIYVYSIDVQTTCDDKILKSVRNKNVAKAEERKYVLPKQGTVKIETRPIVIGSGPAGLFAAYFLADHGFCPIVIERGEDIDSRRETVNKSWETGVINNNSNVQFGEGGAGTFSDGKLNTGVNDPFCRNHLVLQTFVDNGADSEILYVNKPHIGTDQLVMIIRNMRNHIIDKGGEFRFNTLFTKFNTNDGRVNGIYVKKADIIDSEAQFLPSDNVILAIGHSSRDTFNYLINESGLKVEAKAFAVGVRVEHLQSEIGKSQYDENYLKLPAADYKLTYHSKAGNSVYSFCMCPGGFVVNSSSEPGRLCINGMSYSGRDSLNANSAIVAGVKPSENPSLNITFQEEIEKRAFETCGGKIVSQRFEDFEKGLVSEDYGLVKPQHKGLTSFGDINKILPDYICQDIKEAMHNFAGKIKGFDHPDVIISAVESRTSSPIRILRDETMQSCISGIYPIGEGAGYAGGITSAAIDGIKAFEKIYNIFEP